MRTGGISSRWRVCPAWYRVQVALPAPEYGCTAPHQGGDDTLDSDVDPATGATADIALQAGDQRLHDDAGLTLGAGLQVACGVAASRENPWNETVTLPKFGPEFGTLTGVRLTAHQWARRAVYYENLADAQGSYRFSGTNSVTVNGPNGSTLATSVPIGWSSGLWGWDGQPNFVGPSGWIAEMRYFSSQSAAYARPADFLAGAPGETIGLALKGERTISFSASGPYNAKLSSSSGGVVCATYAYTPPCRDPVRPIVAIAAVAGTSDVRLTWSDDPVNEGYEVHCSAEPGFAAGQSTLQVSLPAGVTLYRGPGVLGQAGAHLFCGVRAVNCAGARTADSNRVGTFAFQFAPGLD